MAETQDITNERLIRSIKVGNPVFWSNPRLGKHTLSRFTVADIDDAEARLQRFAPLIATAFPETAASGGIIESPLVAIPEMKKQIESAFGCKLAGSLWLKRDDSLPVSGSIKARGGIYEVLKYAETLALDTGLLSIEDNYAVLLEKPFRDLFVAHNVIVGSTGNLGLSIGIISATLGFNVSVHMSADARQWKKDLLRSKGVNVVEYAADYGTAVKGGRAVAAADPDSHFVDDEDSADLFLGYAVAARRLQKQLAAERIPVDTQHPLCVYLPCGVGGGPGGITYGLKQIFGSAVRCFFAEPVQSPCMLLGLLTGLWNKTSVFDFDLSGKTEADGLAVARPSGLVCREMDAILDGCFTVRDTELFVYLRLLDEFKHMRIEPSACAGFAGVRRAEQDAKNVTHLVWSTGGGMVPDEEMQKYL